MRSAPLAGCPEPRALARAVPRSRRPRHECAFRNGTLCAAPEVAKPAHSPRRFRPRSPRGDRAGGEGTTSRACSLHGCRGSPGKVWGERKPQANSQGFYQCRERKRIPVSLSADHSIPLATKRRLGEVLPRGF